VQQNGLLACPEVDRVVLLDLAGHVVWQKTLAGQTPSSDIGVAARVGDCGYVLLHPPPATAGELLVAPDGSEWPLPRAWSSFERPFAGPIVPVIEGRSGGLFGWWHPGDPVASTSFSVQGPPYVLDPGAKLAFPAHASDGAPVIVHARPHDMQTLNTKSDFGPGGAVFGTGTGAWRGYSLGGQVGRFSVLTGESGVFALTPPAAMSWLGLAPSGIVEDGSFLAALRNAYLAGAYRSADAASWVLVGRTVGQVESVSVSEVAGTYLIDTQGTSSRFVPQQTWQTAPPGLGPELLGESHQIVRPADGVKEVVQLGFSEQVHLSRDGLCAAYWEGSDTLSVHDLARGSRFPVRLPSSSYANHALVWIQ
jgi:hypothetical protein